MQRPTTRTPGILRTLTTTTAVALPLCLTFGCGSDDPDTKPVSSPSAERVEQEARELLDTAADYGRGQQRILERRAKETMAELNRDIESLRAELAATSKDASREAKERLERALERAERARDTIQSEVDDLTDAAENRWERAGRRMSAAVEEAREARREIGRALTGSETKDAS